MRRGVWCEDPRTVDNHQFALKSFAFSVKSAGRVDLFTVETIKIAIRSRIGVPEFHLERQVTNMVRENRRNELSSAVEELFDQPAENDEKIREDVLITGLIDRVENWIARKLVWDARDCCDRRQLAVDIVYQADAYLRTLNPGWTVRDMIALCSTIADRKIVNAIMNSRSKKRSVLLKSLGDEGANEILFHGYECRTDSPAEFNESLQYVWNSLNEDQKRLAKLLTRDVTTTIADIANEMKTTSSSVRRIRNDILEIALIHLNIRKSTKVQEPSHASDDGHHLRCSGYEG